MKGMRFYEVHHGDTEQGEPIVVTARVYRGKCDEVSAKLPGDGWFSSWQMYPDKVYRQQYIGMTARELLALGFVLTGVCERDNEYPVSV